MFDLIEQSSQLCIEFYNDDEVLSTFFDDQLQLKFQLFVSTIEKFKKNVNTEMIMMMYLMHFEQSVITIQRTLRNRQ